MSPKRGNPLTLPWCAPPPPSPQGKRGWGTVYQNLQPREPPWGTGEGGAVWEGYWVWPSQKCLYNGGCGMGWPPPKLKNSILSFLPQPEPNLPDRGSEGLSLPRTSPQGVGRGEGEDDRGEPWQSVLYKEGKAAPPALPVGVHFGG